MRPAFSRLRRKCAANAGFTLVELTVTLLIVVLLGLAVSVGITAGVKVYRQSLFVSESATLNATLNTALSDILRYATNVTPGEPPATPTFNNSHYDINNNGTLMLDENGYLVYTKEPLPDPPPENEEGETEQSGTMVVNRGAYTKLNLADFTFSYDAATDVFSGSYTIQWLGDPSLWTTVTFAFRSIAAQASIATP